jgi:hypothetical protein
MADCVSHNSAMLEIRFTQAARRHRIGRASVRAVEIEQAEGRDPFLLVIHVIPTSLRKGNRDA